VENKFKIQDLPDLCFSRLKSELGSETAEQIPPLQMSVSDDELKKYMNDHYPPETDGGHYKPSAVHGTF
jgi:hypothetical protein